MVNLNVMELCVSIDKCAFCKVKFAQCLLDLSEKWPVVCIHFDTTPSNRVANEDVFSQEWRRQLVMSDRMVIYRFIISSGVFLAMELMTSSTSIPHDTSVAVPRSSNLLFVSGLRRMSLEVASHALYIFNHIVISFPN